jgi:hypothetical protein
MSELMKQEQRGMDAEHKQRRFERRDSGYQCGMGIGALSALREAESRTQTLGFNATRLGQLET